MVKIKGPESQNVLEALRIAYRPLKVKNIDETDPFLWKALLYKEIIGDFGIVKYFFDFLFDIQKGP